MKNIKSILESLLFVSDHPLSVGDFSKLTDYKKDEVEKTLKNLCEDYKKRDSGIEIIRNGKKYQMVTSSCNTEIIQKFLHNETTGELTRPQLETLTTIAYRGPITKPELEQIRGVNCSLVLRNLMMRGLVEKDTSSSAKALEDTYLITLDFLKFLGIREVGELPDYGKLHKHETIEETLNK